MTTSEKVSREALTSGSNLLLALRMSAWVLVLPLAKRLVPIERLARVMWRDGHEPRDHARERLTIRLASRLTRFSGRNCLERSLILYRYLSVRGADPVLVLGIGGLHRNGGHAWVLVDGVPVVDSAASLTAYQPVVAFGRDAKRLPADGATHPSGP